MCYTCGCKLPYEDHGDPANLVEEHLKKAGLTDTIDQAGTVQASGDRPRLTRVQAGIERGEAFSISTPDASRITSVVLSRLPSVTHLAEVDHRTIELQFTKTQ